MSNLVQTKKIVQDIHNEEGKISMSGIHYIPTLVHRKLNNGRKTTEVIPIREALSENNPKLKANQRERMKKMVEHSIKILRAINTE